ncbi:unnamed protein product [[Candida] boidinii]|nr:unnamed protein product [[Candida] boidinii]
MLSGLFGSNGTASAPQQQKSTTVVPGEITTPSTESIALADFNQLSETNTGNESLLSQIVKSNPYFAAGGGLMALGAGFTILRRGIGSLSSFAYRRLLVDLELRNNDKAYDWFLHWMSQYPTLDSHWYQVLVTIG